MITLSPPPLEIHPWQQELATAITDVNELLSLLELEEGDVVGGVSPAAARKFRLRVPRYFAGLMRRGDPDDPLLAQVLPRAAEDHVIEGYVEDPVGDLAAACAHGILQKYRGRALMITTGACAVHCRYCFRRHFPYAEQSVLPHWQASLQALHELPDITELILSGGDPLSLADGRLSRLVMAAEEIPHLRRLRVHTRLPVVLPARITRKLADLLSHSRLQTVMVIHANHPNEITLSLGQALGELRRRGTSLLNQAVLLKSVNDDADTLAELSESLLGIGVLPYYLHLLDPVAGAAHFDVPVERAERLLEQLRLRLPGYLVPRLVRELAGQPFKVPISPL